MKYFDWNSGKNDWLKAERDICFEDAITAINDKKRLLKVEKHKNQKRYPNQNMFIININNYAYLVPFVEDDEKVFLKTIIPSRKATKKYLIKNKKIKS